MTQSHLETETNHDTTTFRHFDREWTVPVRRHLSHLVQLRNGLSIFGANYNVVIAETFLGPQQFAELLELDPDEEALDGFTDVIARTLGLEVAGNS